MDTITICDLAVSFRVGVPDTERANPQRLLLTIELETDFRAAAEKDDIARTIDYHAVTQRILQFGDGRSWKLIETLASEIAEMILREFGARSVSVTVKKFIVPEARYVAVRIERRKSP
jgi:FolB domain-containing protein